MYITNDIIYFDITYPVNAMSAQRKKDGSDDSSSKLLLAYHDMFFCEKELTMTTSSSENIFRVIGFLWGESTGHRRIPLTKASDGELWCFIWCELNQCAWTNGWANSRVAGELGRYGVHCDVTVMTAENIICRNYMRSLIEPHLPMTKTSRHESIKIHDCFQTALMNMFTTR